MVQWLCIVLNPDREIFSGWRRDKCLKSGLGNICAEVGILQFYYNNRKIVKCGMYKQNKHHYASGKFFLISDHKMPLKNIFVIFRFVIFTTSLSQNKVQNKILQQYIKEITSTNQQRTLILIYNNVNTFHSFSSKFYDLELPLYNIYLAQLSKFNGKYDEKYDIGVTYEESKLYFVVLSNLKQLYSDLLLIRKIYFWRDRDKIVVLINEKFQEEEAKATFRHCFQFYIINIVFMFLKDSVSFTYNPFSGNFLSPDKPEHFFPDKFQNLYGYNLKISMFPSVVNIFRNNTYQGRDGVMSRIIAHHLNATYTYLYPRITPLAPVLNQYDDVAERIAEVGFNTRYIKFNFKNLIEKTYPHDRDDLACLIPKEYVQEISLLRTSVWGLSLVASGVFFFYVLITNRRFDVINVLMTILLLLFNKSIKESRNFNFRLALISYLTFCAFLNTLIVCRLASVMTAPKYFAGIETVKELAETNHQILTIDRFQELLNASLISSLRFKILQRLTIIKEEQYLDEINKHRKVAFICKDHLANYAQIQKENYPNGIQFYRVMKERILPALSCYIVSYGSPFLTRFDSLIQRIVESGIHDYWKTKTWEKLEIHHQFQTNQDNYKGRVAEASLQIIQKILVYGLGTASLVFLLELLSTVTIFEQMLYFIHALYHGVI
ncbi:uncharacterized protein LOC123007672 [Tribolium madens]|uniref:uncharacterized protein LOC123007672 n=1 Tax=Tribolium madens TaxID=41895 RepID=UPI001CF72F25|nr:uncharacterized protein LOC123007672 [Tribolium madens]